MATDPLDKLAEVRHLLANEADQDWAEKLALRLLREEQDDEIRASACRALAKSQSDEALEALITGTDNWDSTSSAAVWALANSPHPRATDRVLEELTRCAAVWPTLPGPPGGRDYELGTDHARIGHRLYHLAEALANRPDGVRAVDLLISLARQPVRSDNSWAERIQKNTIQVLGKLGGQCPEVVATLIELLRHKNRQIRWAAQYGLRQVQPASAAASALPELIALLLRTRRDRDLRDGLCETLGGLGSGDERVIAALLKVVQEGRVSCLRALGTLGDMGQAVRHLLPALIQEFRRDNRVAPAIPYTVARIDTEGDVAIPFLIEALQHPDKNIRRDAIENLGDHGEKAAAAVPALIKLLDDKDCRDWVISTLEDLKTAARPALPALFGSIRTWGLQSYRFSWLFGGIDPDGQVAIPGLAALLTEPDPKLRIGALVALGQYGPAAAEVTGAIEPLLADPKRPVREAAREALQRIRPGSS